MMPLQRACDAESQVRNKLSNGPRRVQSNVISQSILQRIADDNRTQYGFKRNLFDDSTSENLSS